MEDIEIISLYFERDERAISETDSKYGSRLHRLADNLLAKEDGEECVNDTYLSAWNSIPPVRPVHFCAWLLKVLRNHIGHRLSRLNAAKRKAVVGELSDELLTCIPGGSVEEEIDMQELGHTLSAFLYSQNPDSRRMFILRYWFGESVREIADVTGSTESRVKVNLHRTRNRLREHLNREGYTL